MKRRPQRITKELTNEQIVWNSGQDLWNYLFEGGRLSHYGDGEEELEEENDWFDEGILWIQEELFDGEVYQVLEENMMYAFTSMGRYCNLKKKQWRKGSLHCNSIMGNITGGSISLSKMARETWGIELVYDNLPKEVKELIKLRNKY